MKRLVSIIVATYNSANTLRECLESVCNQRFQNWECIIVDGASQDSTIDIVLDYESRDERFRHISEPDKGIYDAFNKGWKMAKGEWIHYLGSDDTLTKNSFIPLLEAATDNLGIVSGDVWIKKIDGTIKANISDGFSGCHQGKIVRRSVIECFNGFDQRYRILADLDLMIRLQNAGVKIVNVRSFVAVFVMDGASQSLRGEWKRYKERVSIYKVNKVSNYPVLVCSVLHARMALSIVYRLLLAQFK